jgi:hypothetical protein
MSAIGVSRARWTRQSPTSILSNDRSIESEAVGRTVHAHQS